jgi:thiosulfate/3-mercaptopyruvate sulfurtransferase
MPQPERQADRSGPAPRARPCRWHTRAVTTSPLISVDELASRLLGPDPGPSPRVCDVRWYLGRPGDGRAAYAAGHLPGAIFVDLDEDLADPPGPGRHPLPDPARFVGRLAELGVGRGDQVVAYDDVGGGIAARLWWMLDDLGHEAVRVLDGGLGAWSAAGLPLTTDLPAPAPADPIGPRPWSRVIDADRLTGRLGAVTLVDVRAPERYRGETEPIDPKAGHLPTAVNAPITGNLGPDGRFLAPDLLAARYLDLGPAGQEVVLYCGSGANACHGALAMRIAGLPDPTVYAGSFSDWSRADRDVVTGPEPGSPPTPAERAPRGR